MEFVQIKRRVRGKSSNFWWCKRYSAIWSNLREHSENVFAVNLGYRDNIQSTIVISKSKGLYETLRDIRTWTYQICGTEENN